MHPKKFSTRRGEVDGGCLMILAIIVLLSWLSTHSLASLAVWGLLALAALALLAVMVWLGVLWRDARRRRREAAAPKPAPKPAPPIRRFDLDPSQLAAARSRAPRTLVEGGPGTGKTEVVARWAVGLIAEGVDPSKVLILTPNLRAAKAMRQRTAQLLSELPEPKAPPTVGTFLSVAEALFREDPAAFGLRPDFTILSEYDSAQLWQTALKETAFPCQDYWQEALRLRPKVAKAEHHHKDQRHKARLSKYSAVWNRYAKLKLERNWLDSEDVLKGLAPFPASRRLRERHPCVAVDDLQNCSSLEYEVLFRWYPTPLFVTGDNDQAIGLIRGADDDRLREYTCPALEEPEENDPPAPPDVVRMTLDFNHRADRPLIRFANDALKRVLPSSRPLRAAPDTPNPAPQPRQVFLYEWPHPAAEAQAAYDWFRNLLAHGAKPADLCVLARTPSDLSKLIGHLNRNHCSYEYHNSLSLTNVPEPGAQDDSLTLGSIHSAAGREWKHVLLMGMGELQMPHPKNNPSEERRLFYVAVTRARQTLTYFYSSQLPPQKPCPFLPADRIEWENPSLRL